MVTAWADKADIQKNTRGYFLIYDVWNQASGVWSSQPTKLIISHAQVSMKPSPLDYIPQSLIHVNPQRLWAQHAAPVLVYSKGLG